MANIIRDRQKIAYARFDQGKVMLTKRDIDIIKKIKSYRDSPDRKQKTSMTQLARAIKEPLTSVCELLHKLNGHRDFFMHGSNIPFEERLFYLHQHPLPYKNISYPTFVIFCKREVQQ